MELRQLYFFKKAAELEHITRAAEELDTSQPYLSKMISELEEELGVSLFDHIGRSIKLNLYGKQFYQRVCHGLQELEDGKRELRDLYVQSELRVRIVTNSSLYMPEILSRFRRYYPNVQISQVSAGRNQMIRMLQSDEADFAVTSPPLMEDENFENQILLREVCRIIYPKDHWLTGRKEVPLRLLEKEPFITAAPGFAIRDQTDIFFERIGIRPNYVIQFTDTYNIPEFVMEGLGIAFSPWFVLKRNRNLEMQSVAVSDPVCQGEVALAWKKDRYLNQTCQIFRDFVVRYFQTEI